MAKLTSKNYAYVGVSLVALATSMNMSSVAVAQDDGEDTIVVTGFRGSLGAALGAKRDETSIVDVVKAEDIADFPDLNLAESLQRIPGVAIDRQAGEGRQITVRGLGGDFTRVRVNGMEALTTGGGSDASGGTNRSRTFDFNTFASELFSELRVRKSQSAEVEEGSLGANVELRTAQPFDYGPGFTGAVSGQAFYNDLSEDVGPRLAGLLSYTNPDETFGILASVAYSSRKIREEGFSTVRFDDLATFRSVSGVPCVGSPLPTDCQTLRNSYYARIPRYGRLDYDQERIGITGSMQFRPTERTTLSLDGLYSIFNSDRSEEFLEVFIRSETDNLDVTDFTVNSDGVLSYLQADIQADLSSGIIPVRSEHRQDKLNTDFYQFSGNLEHEFNDRFRANIFGGLSRSEFDNPQQATIFYDAANPVIGYSYDLTNNLNTPDVDFGSLDVTDPTQFLFTQYRNRPQGTDNSYDTIQGNFEYDLSENLTVKAGGSWKQFGFETFEARAEGDVEDLPGFTGPVPVTSALAGLLEGFGQGLNLPSNVDTSWTTADFDAAADLINLFGLTPVENQGNTRSVSEKDVGGYVQADFNFMLGAMPVRGDIGMRYVQTKTASTGFLSGSEVTVNRKYDDWLPALNLVLEPVEDVLIRGGVAKVMARPNLGNLTPGGNIDTFTGPPFRVSQGNPALDPYRSLNFDLSFEWYFQPESLVAVGLFHKDISSFFLTSDVVTTTFSATGLPTTIASPTSPLAMLLAGGGDPAVEVTQVVNGGDGKISGLEFVYQQPFTFLPGPLGNLGFTGNYTYVKSTTIIGFSPNSFNATLYYEDGPFSARVTGAYRDAYQDTRPASSGRTEGREERGRASTFNLDFSTSYQVTEDLALTFEAINLTDEVEHQTFDRLLLPTLYHHTGRNFLLGARYKF